VLTVTQMLDLLIAKGLVTQSEVDEIIENTDPLISLPTLSCKDRKRLKRLHNTLHSDSKTSDYNLIMSHCTVIDGVIKVDNPEFW
jgi:hypothetical protein